MSGRRTDVAIIGGGLSGGLIALALNRQHPAMEVALIEQGENLGGNHRWSWFDSDLDAASHALLQPFFTTCWHGYDVKFPAYSRQLSSPYKSLSSQDFDSGLRRELAADTILTGTAVAALDAHGVAFADGTRLSARIVLDCRGAVPSAHLTGGWQVFMGRHIRLAHPHGLDRPVIMDAAINQHGAYRFVYVLPLSNTDLFIEDTYYADEPALYRDILSARIDAYCRSHDWKGDIIGVETGVLPVITGGNFAAYQQDQRIDGVGMAGARGGFVHPLTSYTLPFAVETALAIASNAQLPGAEMAQMLEQRARQHWSATAFYRLLGTMLFGAALPEERYKVFEHFYRLPENLIERFYAAHSTLPDKARILVGKPPVSVAKAIGALIGRGRPLVAPQENI